VRHSASSPADPLVRGPCAECLTECFRRDRANVIEQAGEHLRELRVAEVVAKDMVLRVCFALRQDP